VHLGSMPAAVRAAIDACGSGVGPGDQIAVNDPFAGGTHLNDITLVMPVFAADGALLGWAANRAHHADLGGMAPGSMPPDATEIYQEGFRIPPVRWTPEVEALLLAASRTPDERRGDLDAQLCANAVGETRRRELAPPPDVFAEIVAYGERRMRTAITALPDGVYEFSDALDSTGAGGTEPARIAVRVTVAGEEITFDFTGTDAQRPGSVNAVEAVTVSSVVFALRTVVDPELPANGGALRPVHVIAPAGSIVAAQPPVAVGAGNVEVSQRVADVCLGALARAAPARVGAASQGTMNNVLIGGDGWVYYETIGGDGIAREIEMLEAVTVSLVTERRVSQPWGLAGGAPGASGENWLLPQGNESRAERLPDKCTITMAAGDVLRILTPGGGGWGTP
jgi:N-methylhydantoinase B/oxoprolinase/acetone carboxylase alpha subunit